MASAPQNRPDIVLIGAGVMSATLGTLLLSLDPGLEITCFETLDACGLESSQAWNNAGTGHAGNCELNYTPQRADGSVDITKALEVNAQFDESRSFWTYLVRSGQIARPEEFIRACPHISFVTGKQDVAFLKARHDAMSAHHCFRAMEYSEDPAVIAQWAPLIMQGRDLRHPVAATRVADGTDIDFGALTRNLFSHMAQSGQAATYYSHKVTEIRREPDDRWHIVARHTKTGETKSVSASFVFIGAGGAALELLQKANIPEAKAYAGFPVSGQWLRCDAPDIVAQHDAKVYGKAALGSPPMSVPHLDTRTIGAQRHLLFGPYAGFSTKFLKRGSWTDFYRTLNTNNVLPTLQVGKDNLSLVKYLIEEVLQSRGKRFSSLLNFYPAASPHAWKLAIAGQRVQIIKPDGKKRGTLKFGTELVSDADNSLIALLGASPGASVAASVALQIVQTCFSHCMRETDWQRRLHAVFPFYGIDLTIDRDACATSRRETAEALGL